MSKTLIVLMVGMLAVGCGKTDTERLELENRRLKAQLENNKLKAEIKELTLEEKVVGGYQSTHDGGTLKYVFMENGFGEWFLDDVVGKKEQEYKWKLTKEGEIHVTDSTRLVFRINKDGSITAIAYIDKDGKRVEGDEEAQRTYKRIK